MNNRLKAKGSQTNRFAIRFLTIVLTILIFWALGFLVDDIQSIPGPDLESIATRYLDSRSLGEQKSLDGSISALNLKIKAKQDEQRLLGESSRNLQQTINQLLDLQKQTLQKELALSAATQQNLSSSLNTFLDNQRAYQALNTEVVQLTAEKRQLESDRKQVDSQLQKQRQPAEKEYDNLSHQHRLKLAGLQLLVLLPLLGASAFLIVRKRMSIYAPLILALAIATLLRIIFVLGEYFPARWFQYILMAALIAAVGLLLRYFIRSVAFPKAQFLIQQFREAYQSFLCPICEYPMRTGPRRYLFWTRRTVNKIIVPANSPLQEEPYTCPSCGTTLLEECSVCNHIRHALLPHCQHCGTEKDIRYGVAGISTPVL